MTGPAPAPALDLVALSGDIARRVGVKAERGAPLAKLTTMRVGGPADLFATYSRYIWGRDAHKAQIFGAGVSVYFGLPD